MIENIQIGDTFAGRIDGVKYKVTNIKEERTYVNGKIEMCPEVYYAVVGKELKETFHLPLNVFQRLKITKV